MTPMLLKIAGVGHVEEGPFEVYREDGLRRGLTCCFKDVGYKLEYVGCIAWRGAGETCAAFVRFINTSRTSLGQYNSLTSWKDEGGEGDQAE